MREIFTYGSVGGAPGNRCIYPESLGLDNVSIVSGRFQDTLDKVLNEQGVVDYAFIDGHHDEKATRAYFEQISPFLSEKALIILDDISWSAGMKRAWSAVETDERVNLSIDLSTVGICIIDTHIERKQSLRYHSFQKICKRTEKS